MKIGKRGWIWLFTVLTLGLLLLSACDPVTRHKVLTTIFDGVPSPIPPEKILEDYYQQRRQQELAQAAGVDAGTGQTGRLHVSKHRPYAEKRCKDCHDFTTRVGLVRPPRELCFLCHQDFRSHLRDPYVHGPVAVGDCSACHLPHSSENTFLLEMDRNEICGKCHQEARLAVSMHEQVLTHGMACVDCHDPHFGQARYFLK
ncbi:MAG: cytochrome c3 family protein [Pseudomonadota bacterium]|nr:cytochrome c3 family protein [Pseudomonadota bacterium]